MIMCNCVNLAHDFGTVILYAKSKLSKLGRTSLECDLYQIERQVTNLVS